MFENYLNKVCDYLEGMAIPADAMSRVLIRSAYDDDVPAYEVAEVFAALYWDESECETATMRLAS